MLEVLEKTSDTTSHNCEMLRLIYHNLFVCIVLDRFETQHTDLHPNVVIAQKQLDRHSQHYDNL